MGEPDFRGLRTAVEDAVERAPYETLRRRAAGRRRRRTGLVATGVAAVAAVAVLALPRVDPASEPAGPPAPVPVTGQLVDIAFGRTAAYALLGDCEPAVTGCRYDLLASGDAGRTWTRLRAPLPPPADGDGFSAELLVTGDDDLAVRDPIRARIHVSTDRGRTFAVRTPAPGPAVDAVPPGLHPEATQCGGEGCRPARVVVLDPATGRQHPLRSQPVTGSTHLDVAVGVDGRIWVTGRDGGRLVTAVSADRGRSWQTLGALSGPPVRLYRVVPLPGPGAGAYLVTGQEDDQRALNAFSDLWRLDGTGWTRVTPPGAPWSALTSVGLLDGELLLTTEQSEVWRTSGRGTRIDREPAAGPLSLLRRTGSLLVGESDNGTLTVSGDDGLSWEPRLVAVG